MFDVQYRMVNTIGTMISKLFYVNKTFPRPIDGISEPAIIILTNFFNRFYRVRSPLIVLNVENKPTQI